MLTCRPVNLSPRVNRSRGEYRRAMHYGYSLLVHLSTCQPVLQGLTGPEVNIGVHGIMGIPYLFTCENVNLSLMIEMSYI